MDTLFSSVKGDHSSKDKGSLLNFITLGFQVDDVEDLHLYINYKFIVLIAGRIRASASCSFMQSSGSRLPVQ